MKRYKIIFILFLTLFASSCEEVIDVNLETAAPRLVVYASIQWEKGTLGKEQNQAAMHQNGPKGNPA